MLRMRTIRTALANRPAVVTQPIGTTDACACDSCSVTASPSCVTGAIALSVDTDGSLACGTAASPLANMTPGGCNTDNFHGPVIAADDVKLTPLPPTGGTCAAGSPTAHPERVAFSERGRICASDDAVSGCVDPPCAQGFAAPFAPCLAHAGSVGCPAGPFGVAHHLGTGAASVSCTDTCSCNVAATCVNATVTYYGDKMCKGPMTLPTHATGTCLNQGGTGMMYGAYTYSATTSASCSANGSTVTSVALAGEQTICCAR